jgi:hypothetical protein
MLGTRSVDFIILWRKYWRLQDLILKTHRSDPQTNVTLPDLFSRRLEMKLAKSVAAGSSAMAQLSAGSQVAQPGLG